MKHPSMLALGVCVCMAGAAFGQAAPGGQGRSATRMYDPGTVETVTVS